MGLRALVMSSDFRPPRSPKPGGGGVRVGKFGLTVATAGNHPNRTLRH